MLFMGIDPGEDGAIAIIEEKIATVDLYDCPKTDQEMKDLLINFNHNSISIAIEKATKKIKLPNRMIHATVLWGNFRAWCMACTCLGFRYEIVPARRWQNILDKNKKLNTKERAWETACRLYPDAVPLLKGKRGAKKYGRSDALCIAEWARRNL